MAVPLLSGRFHSSRTSFAPVAVAVKTGAFGRIPRIAVNTGITDSSPAGTNRLRHCRSTARTR